MKWLATTFLCLLTSVASAEPQQPNPPNVIALPLFMVCSDIDPEPGLEKNFQEIPFVEGDASINIGGGKQVQGRLQMFLTQDMKTFTIMFEVGDEMYCMVMTGENLEPSMRGKGI